MSHYWSMHGSIILSAPPPGDFDVLEYIDENIIELEDNVIKIGGNDNHLPSRIDDMLKVLKSQGISVMGGEGTYHAEDNMAGEWCVQNNEIEIEEYSDTIEKLRSALSAAKEELEALWSFYGQNLRVENWHLNGDLEPLDHFFESNSCDALEKIKEALGE